jgi:hypothetical protein
MHCLQRTKPAPLLRACCREMHACYDIILRMMPRNACVLRRNACARQHAPARAAAHLLRRAELQLCGLCERGDVLAALAHNAGDARMCIEQIHRGVALERQHRVERKLVVGES